MRIDSGCAEGKETSRLRRILEIIRPGDAMIVEQVENRSGNWFVSSWRRKGVVGGQMSERSCRHQIRAVGKRGAEHGREVAVVDGKFLRQIVVKRKIFLIHGKPRLWCRYHRDSS